MTKVYLDPGHGGSDPGATGNGLQEKNVVLKIARYTRDYLQNNYSGVSVRMSRTDDSFPSLSDRANDANSWGAGIFVSIHANAFNGSAHGYEDFIFNGNVSSDSHKLQDNLHKEIAPLFRNNRGKKQANFAVLRQSSMPAVLTENGFIDNKQDADFLKKDSNLKKIAEAHAKGIAVYLGLSGGSSSSGSSSTSSWNNMTNSQKYADATKAIQAAGLSVKQYQQRLINAGHNLPQFGTDGTVGAETLTATKDFQRAHDLSSPSGNFYGRPGPATVKKLNEVSSSGKKQVHLPATADTWRTYKLNVQPVKANSDWSLTPAAFGGLTYDILDEPYPGVVTINTGRGKRNIFVKGTSATIN